MLTKDQLNCDWYTASHLRVTTFGMGGACSSLQAAKTKHSFLRTTSLHHGICSFWKRVEAHSVGLLAGLWYEGPVQFWSRLRLPLWWSGRRWGRGPGGEVLAMEARSAPRSWRGTFRSGRRGRSPATSPRRSSRSLWWSRRDRRRSPCRPLQKTTI